MCVKIGIIVEENDRQIKDVFLREYANDEMSSNMNTTVGVSLNCFSFGDPSTGSKNELQPALLKHFLSLY
jgi:hypothetical protein